MEQRPRELGELIIRGSPQLASLERAEVTWLSPLAAQDYLEYRDDFLGQAALNLPQHLPALKKFWPGNGPQWDGLAVLRAAETTAVLLLEAKAHPGETLSSCGATSPVSIEKIRSGLAEVQAYLGVQSTDWMNGSYQMANRLAYLYFLHVKRGVPSYLVLINFVNDRSYRPTSQETWLRYPWTQALGVPDGHQLAHRVLTVHPEAF